MKNITKLDMEILLIHLKKGLSINNVPIGTEVINNFIEEMQSGSSSIIDDITATVMEDAIEKIYCSDKHSEILSQLKKENNYLRSKLNNSKPKPKTYKNIIKNSLGNNNFHVDTLVRYLDGCSTSNIIIIEYVEKAANQLIDLVHTLGLNNGK